MVLYINDEKIDFTLEGGEKAGDIYDSVRTFLSGSERLVYSFMIDNLETDPQDSSWRQRDVSEIEKIDVTALTETEYRLTGILTVAEFINFLIHSISENKIEGLRELVKEYPSISRNIPVFVQGEKGELIKEHLDMLMEKSGLTKSELDNEYRKEFLSEIEKVSELIKSAAREIEDPMKELENSIKAVNLLNPKLSDVSLLLQTGKDKDAMDIVISLTEILQKIIGLLTLFNSDNIDIDKLNNILNELVEAFDAGDSILIGDLLEYEISPILSDLTEQFERLKEREDD
ncbi:hypothetical protein [Spirochaeta isovalerica]|uniref:Uncharacterized protein n=1 Tax=Spirochaeta isovalerica TaxID=150 RepID=A0A841R4B4_9SPIO|nr:hypothetical protein [Spirochaeta isovalerica]MBB6478695.1 hypothetical protein [Spirochaeta isovalerica]